MVGSGVLLQVGRGGGVYFFRLGGRGGAEGGGVSYQVGRGGWGECGADGGGVGV